jgi:DNA-binding NarL/FixJ family response regulator
MYPLESLSQRELEIAQLMGQGYLSKEISDKLFIANNTVNTHRQNMLRKTNFYDANELINFLRVYRII